MPDLPEDIESVKKSRTAAKGQITNTVNKLKVIFGEVDLEVKNINDIEVQDLFRKLRKHFQQFEQLHDHYTSLREATTTDKEEEETV